MDIEKLAQQAQIDSKTAARILEEAKIQEKQRQREQQAQGIAQAKARGIRFGRPRANITNIARMYELYAEKKISLEEGARQYGVSRSTFYRRLREYAQEQKEQRA